MAPAGRTAAICGKTYIGVDDVRGRPRPTLVAGLLPFDDDGNGDDTDSRVKLRQATEQVSESRDEMYMHTLPDCPSPPLIVNRNEIFDNFRTKYEEIEQEISDLWEKIIEEVHPFTVRIVPISHVVADRRNTGNLQARPCE